MSKLVLLTDGLLNSRSQFGVVSVQVYVSEVDCDVLIDHARTLQGHYNLALSPQLVKDVESVDCRDDLLLLIVISEV